MKLEAFIFTFAMVFHVLRVVISKHIIVSW